jgi:two-component system chemotaxis sensor kinase CheA
MAPVFRKSGLSGRASQVADALRGTLHAIEASAAVDQGVIPLELAEQVQVLDDQTREWDQCRRTFGELVATVDQLTRVSQSLQRGVLSTRMVPVGPLLSRFKRSVRDIANELGKKVSLELVGEKTELDKRMIDEIGDPLNHLIRNAIDHGIEPGDVRIRRGKPEVATVRLSASHRGNNVFITVEDDGAGIDVERVREIAVARGLVTEEQAARLEEHDVIELIWQPGFSTAATVSDISGRGVGMDIVRTKIRALNGSIDVASARGAGTTFTIRLPLTLTITHCMLFQTPQAVFAAPIENVREIVRLADHQIVVANGRQFADVRGDFLPLIGIGDLFDWQGGTHGVETPDNVVILHADGQAFGLRVNMLLGGQDIVVKPLDENYTHIRGLGGASVLGDGSVCLLLDVATCVGLASPQKGSRAVAAESVAEAVAFGTAARPLPTP